MGRIAILCDLSGTGWPAGDAIAGRLADEGFDLAVLGPSPDACAPAVERARRSGRRAMALAVPAGDDGSVQQAVDDVDEHLGPPDLLLNVVDATLGGPLSEAADWGATVGGPLRQTFLISQAVLDLMIREGCGRIVTVADVLGVAGRRENATVRAGLEGFIKTLALEADAFGVTANLVVAGLGVRAPAAAEILPRAQESSAPGGWAPDAPNAPGEPGAPTLAAPELADTVAFLAGAAGAIVSGQVIHVAAADPTV